jgi:hypothetical protein
VALLLFFAGVFLPFLAGWPYTTEYESDTRSGIQWIRKGILESSGEIVRAWRAGGEGFPLRDFSWLYATASVFCLPASLAFQRKPGWAALLAAAGSMGVWWMFLMASPRVHPVYFGAGLISWNSCALLTLGISLWSLGASWIEDPEEGERTEASEAPDPRASVKRDSV